MYKYLYLMKNNKKWYNIFRVFIRSDKVKKKIFVLLGIGLLLITGCGKKIEPGKQQGQDDNSTMVGYYEAYETVQYGKKYSEKETKSENITLLVRDDNTATLKWGNSEGKDYKIEGNKFLALAGDEEGTITYKNGTIKVELSDGDYIAFKK